MPKISVIVPVYNVEQYLSACVESILAQTFQDFELILVDDGSPDSCGAMCDAYAQKDPRVRVIHQENQGLSGARNTGIKAASGEYITFIDSDDLVKKDYLEKLLRAIKVESADISVCKPQEFEDGKNSVCLETVSAEAQHKCFSNIDVCVELYNVSSQIPINAWGKLYRADLISDMEFPVGRIHEDQAFVPVACYRAGKIVLVDSPIYCYRQRPESIMQTKFSLKRYDDIWAIDNCIAFFEANQATQIVAAAKEKRKRQICIYAIYARRNGVEVPKKYRVGAHKALFYLRKRVPEEKFFYYLGQVNMLYARLYMYWAKLKEILKIDR